MPFLNRGDVAPKRESVPLYGPEYPDAVWSADFMLDALACGRSFYTFNIIDDFNREIVNIEVDTSITSQRLVRIFEQIRQERTLPQVLRTDNGPEFLGEAFTQWAKANGMAIRTSNPARPTRAWRDSVALRQGFRSAFRADIRTKLFACHGQALPNALSIPKVTTPFIS